MQFMFFLKSKSKTCLYQPLPKEDEVWAYQDCTLCVIDALLLRRNHTGHSYLFIITTTIFP